MGITPGSFGLDQVDNTADLDKPVSLALSSKKVNLQKIFVRCSYFERTIPQCQMDLMFTAALNISMSASLRTSVEAHQI